ncbi:MAG TPA: fibronectin type III domain-containing protein, partial [Actinomycetota bacterium]|nr:fibronectin type III domain-containing protein [Actinomycetota bacterium]
MGDPQAVRDLLQAALRMDPTSTEGRAARRALGRSYRRRARLLVRQAEHTSGDAAAALLDEANESFFMALVAAHAPGLEEAIALFASPESASPPVAGVPDAPRFVVAEGTRNVADLSISVTWEPPADATGITGYDIKMTPSVGAPKSVPVASSVRTYKLSGLVASVGYELEVRAKSSAGTGEWADAIPSKAVAGSLAPGAPTLVKVSRAGATPKVEWAPPLDLDAPIAITGYLLTAYRMVGTVREAVSERQLADVTAALLPGLAPGLYAFGVRALGLAGASLEALSPIVAVGDDFAVRLPAISKDPAVAFETTLDDFNAQNYPRLLSDVESIGRKWRYDHLREQATSAAQHALEYDRLIVELMGMTLDKAGFAETILSPALAAAVTHLKEDQQILADYATSDTVKKVAGEIGDLTSRVLLLRAILKWLVENEPVAFWVGLFESLIRDLSALSMDLKATRAYLESEFATGPVGKAVQGMASELARQSGQRVDSMIAPLRVVVDQVVGGTSHAMQKVFESFDLPLLMRPTADADQPPVPNVNPLDKVLRGLDTAVEGLSSTVKKSVAESLANAGKGSPELFTSLMVSYVVLPILAFVLVGMAAGPATAAALAAVVTLGAQQLMHVIARWLTGPLDGEIERLEADIERKFEELRHALAQHVTGIKNPTDELDLLASELLQLKELVPEVFLQEAATVLGHARDVVLRGGTRLALAAERALGIECATAFDVIRLDYRPGLPPAPQLPGGTAPSLFGGANLLADLDRLERGRLQLRDAKEVEVTYRLSLARLLGRVEDLVEGTIEERGGFDRFVRAGRTAVGIDALDLTDSMFPGLYRPLIKEVRVLGEFGDVPTGLTTYPVPVTVTHSGTSSTRINRAANPLSPPVVTDVPKYLRKSPEDFAAEILSRLPDVYARARDAAMSQLPPQVAVAVVWPFYDYYGMPDYLAGMPARIADTITRSIPREIAAAVGLVGYGKVHQGTVRETAAAALALLDWSIPGYTSDQSHNLWTVSYTRPDDAQMKQSIDDLKIVNALEEPIREAAKDAFGAAKADARAAIEATFAK